MPAPKRAVHRTGIAAGTQPRLPSLEQALGYRNDQILYKFQERWAVNFEEAAELFEETKKWLWVQVAARVTPGAPPMAMTVALAMLDEMLHTFILFTREYVEYCEENYGAYLHHAPMTRDAKNAQLERFRKDPDGMLAQEGEFLRNMYSFVYDLLGEETVVRWYSEYAEKYSGARMAELSGDGRRFARADAAGLTG
ncbi:MAG TPA: hypothetical protein VMT17_18400 [Anaeromyxobacteraceae bacterium]|nr:hypothetical protein [Anaeromyxobacteraceae bacterium]